LRVLMNTRWPERPVLASPQKGSFTPKPSCRVLSVSGEVTWCPRLVILRCAVLTNLACSAETRRAQRFGVHVNEPLGGNMRPDLPSNKGDLRAENAALREENAALRRDAAKMRKELKQFTEIIDKYDHMVPLPP